MDILRQQLKRIFSAPFFLGLLVVFLLFNMYLISSNFGIRREISLINDIAGKTGVKIDADFNRKFSSVLSTYKKDLKGLYQSKTGKSSDDTSSMLEKLSKDYYSMPVKQQNRLRDDSTVLQLDEFIHDRNSFYEGYDVNKSGQLFFRQSNVTGLPKIFFSGKFKQLQKREAQIKSDGEKDTLFFPGTIYGMHGFLYGTLMKSILMESAILGVLTMFFTLNYEFAHGTQSLAYTSRRGRRLPADQFGAAMLAGISVPAFLMSVSLPVFFCNYHFTNLWGSYVSSAMNTEPHGMYLIPYITFWPMTMWQYLWANISLIFVVQAVFCLLAFSMAVFLRNSYIGFLIYALAGMAIINIPSILPWNTLLTPILSANPVVAWYDCRNWLTQVDLFDAYPQYYLLIFLLGAVVTAAAAIIGLRRFRRADM